MSFVTNLDNQPPLPVPETNPDRVIELGWFPDIDPAVVRKDHRIREGVTADRLRTALIAAIISVGNDLGPWQAAQSTAGFDSLADVPELIRIDGESRLVHCYRRAVALYAKAEIVERYRDIDTSATGERRADDLDPSVTELRRDGLHAIRDILGKGRTTVELI
ncbi:MAG TPA: head completion/stabilization protein [Sphingobium sp.]|uniref:head completion/stabilization protein n=1 Tax=Sphingobium sp. TaxID=1912891 RepID=UPI002ED5035D